MDSSQLMGNIANAPIIPVVTLENAEQAIAVADALAEGGVTCIEVTLRTEAGLCAIEALAKQGSLLVGAGTVTTEQAMQQVQEAGAQFAVSPGNNPALMQKADALDLAFLPGVATPSDIVVAQAANYRIVKFFPAGLFGGASALQHYGAVFPHMQFCPTGGINRDNMRDYLRLFNVPCVGGSWLVTSELLEHENWQAITQRTREALATLDNQ